jgi:hypothetical protein
VDAVHEHPASVVTVIVPVAPAAGIVTLTGVAETVHDTPASVTRKLRPAIASVAVRAVTLVFGWAANETVPDPVPVEPADIVTHAAPLAAVQVHPGVVVTVTVPLPPGAGSVALEGAIVYEQAAAACVTVNVLPPAVNVPVREVVAVFACTLYPTLPLPLPVPPAVMLIQLAPLVAVHPQPAGAVTLIVPPPPPATTVADAGEIVGAHGTPAWVTVKVRPATVRVPLRDVELVLAATL